MANAIKYYYGRSTYYRGPSIRSVVFRDGNRNQVIVPVDHRGGTDITPATGITGFAVLDNGSTVTIQSVVRYGPDEILLTVAGTIPAGHAVTLRYPSGMTPATTGLVKDDSPLALPLENTTSDLTIADLPS